MGYPKKLSGGDDLLFGPGKVGVISEGENDAFWHWDLRKERANGRWVWGWQIWHLLWAGCTAVEDRGSEEGIKGGEMICSYAAKGPGCFKVF